jgi:hypothetical protein
MRLPRLRFTVRRMMVVVAVLALELSFVAWASQSGGDGRKVFYSFIEFTTVLAAALLLIQVRNDEMSQRPRS